MTVIEYAEVANEKDEWYHWKDIEYDSNFYYGDSMQAGFGMHNHEGFVGEPIARGGDRRRGNRPAAARESQETQGHRHE